MCSSSTRSLWPYLSRCDNHTLYIYTGRLIPEFALLGYTDIAGRLLGRLNKHDLYHDCFPFRESGELWFLWDLRAKEDGVPWPEGEEEKVRRAVKERRAKMRRSDDNIGEGPDEAVTPDDVHRELELRAKESDRPRTITQMLIDARDIIQRFKTAGSTPEIHVVRSDLTKALDSVLAAEAQHEKQNEGKVLDLRGAPSSDELLQWLAHSLGENYHENMHLRRSRQAWKLYKSGALRRALNVDEAALTAFANDFEVALTERLTNGRSRPSAHLSIPELVETVQHNTQAIKTDPGHEEYHGVNDPVLFNSPATEEQIAEAEARLDTTLPSDYTTFLRITNGTIGHMWDQSLGGFQPPLHPVEQVRWLDPVQEDYFTGLSLDMPARWDKWPFAPPPTEKGYGGDNSLEHFVIGRALEIGAEQIDNVWLIPPATTVPIKEAAKKILDDESLSELDRNSVRTTIRDFAGSEEAWEKMEWACVTWASGGVVVMRIYLGFAAYLEDVVGRERITAEGNGEGGDEGEQMLRKGRWLGSLFGKSGERKKEEGVHEVPDWLNDAVRATARPTRRNLTEEV